MSDYYTLILDPPAVATGRTQLSLNDAPINIGGTSSGQGIDWGEDQITEYLAEQGTYGSTVADYIVPNRTVTIPLGAGTNVLEDSVETALENLREKVSLLQEEGGWLMRQRAGGPPMYADIVSATLQVPDDWAETGGVEPDITLTLECLPDFYGDEITLDTLSCTGYCSDVLTLDTETADIEGDGPGRVRIIVTDTSDNNQLGLIWGLQSRYYDAASTAELVYQAQAMTPVNGAATATPPSGAASSNVVKITGLPAGSWVPFLATTLLSGGPLTHRGSFRVWARCYSSTGTPQLQLLWGVGSLSAPETNTAIALPGDDALYMLDLGTIRLDPPPVGDMEWIGVLQAFSAAGGDNVEVDELLFQPIDDTAGQCEYLPLPPPSAIAASANAGAGADLATGAPGSLAWTNPGNIALTGQQAEVDNTGAPVATHFLKATDFAFAIPSGATIVGIEAAITRSANLGSVDDVVKLVKAGAVTGSNRSTGATWSASATTVTFGSPTDLWGASWAPTDINSSGFGVALAPIAASDFSLVSCPVTITVYYTLASGFTVAQDAVVYADQTTEIRTDGSFRTPGSDVYGPVSIETGNRPRIPPSRMENRPCRLFVKPSRGDLDELPDPAVDAFTVHVIYRPVYAFRP